MTVLSNDFNLFHPYTDVPTWLKSLRLHKYQGLFQQMAYDEMMGLTETDLERMVSITWS